MNFMWWRHLERSYTHPTEFRPKSISHWATQYSIHTLFEIGSENLSIRSNIANWWACNHHISDYQIVYYAWIVDRETPATSSPSSRIPVTHGMHCNAVSKLENVPEWGASCCPFAFFYMWSKHRPVPRATQAARILCGVALVVPLWHPPHPVPLVESVSGKYHRLSSAREHIQWHHRAIYACYLFGFESSRGSPNRLDRCGCQRSGRIYSILDLQRHVFLGGMASCIRRPRRPSSSFSFWWGLCSPEASPEIMSSFGHRVGPAVLRNSCFVSFPTPWWLCQSKFFVGRQKAIVYSRSRVPLVWHTGFNVGFQHFATTFGISVLLSWHHILCLSALGMPCTT